MRPFTLPEMTFKGYSRSLTMSQFNRPHTTTHSGGTLRWVNSCMYLGIYVVSARSFKRTFELARAKFCKAFNAIFGKKREICTIQYHNELSVLQMSPNAFICHWSLSLLVAWSEFNMFWITRVLMKTVNTRSRDITEQCQLTIDMLAVVHQVFMRKTRFLLRFR